MLQDTFIFFQKIVSFIFGLLLLLYQKIFLSVSLDLDLDKKMKRQINLKAKSDDKVTTVNYKKVTLLNTHTHNCWNVIS